MDYRKLTPRRRRSRRAASHATVVAALCLLVTTPVAAAPAEKIQFEPFLFPEMVIIDSERTMTLCLVNQGLENELIGMGSITTT